MIRPTVYVLALSMLYYKTYLNTRIKTQLFKLSLENRSNKMKNSLYYEFISFCVLVIILSEECFQINIHGTILTKRPATNNVLLPLLDPVVQATPSTVPTYVAVLNPSLGGSQVCAQTTPSYITPTRSRVGCAQQCSSYQTCVGFNLVFTDAALLTCQLFTYMTNALDVTTGCVYYEVCCVCHFRDRH